MTITTHKYRMPRPADDFIWAAFWSLPQHRGDEHARTQSWAGLGDCVPLPQNWRDRDFPGPDAFFWGQALAQARTCRQHHCSTLGAPGQDRGKDCQAASRPVFKGRVGRARSIAKRAFVDIKVLDNLKGR